MQEYTVAKPNKCFAVWKDNKIIADGFRSEHEANKWIIRMTATRTPAWGLLLDWQEKNGFIEAYFDDLLVWDLAELSEHPYPLGFVWIARTSGTHIFGLRNDTAMDRDCLRTVVNGALLTTNGFLYDPYRVFWVTTGDSPTMGEITLEEGRNLLRNLLK